MITKQHARLLRQLIVKASESLSDTDALEAVELFPRWSDSAEYVTGDRVSYDGILYKCLLDHTAQPSWTPDVSPSIWVRVDDPGEEWPEWRQPTGSTDAYAFGAKVSHNNKHWISNLPANTYEPGVYGWDEAE